jgi:site-specific recombinase XerD
VSTRKTRSGKHEYDFRLLGERERKGRFRTAKEAQQAERLKREELLSGKKTMLFSEAYEKYMASLGRKAISTVESYKRYWEDDIQEHLAHLYLEDVSTDALDGCKQKMPPKWSAKTINQRLILIRAVLRFAWKRQWLAAVPFVPMEKLDTPEVQWHQVDERDALLEGFFTHQPRWYFFFYLSSRLGLRVGEVYPFQHTQMRCDRLQVVIDRAAERGTKERDVIVKLHRKAKDTLTLEITPDIVSAYRWHCAQGFAGEVLVFCPNDVVPKYLDSHKVPLEIVLKKTGIRRLTHHKLGRHSVGSQADDAGATQKSIQRQLGHKSAASTAKYVHGSSKGQREIVEKLRPTRAPHELAREPEPSPTSPEGSPLELN